MRSIVFITLAVLLLVATLAEASWLCNLHCWHIGRSRGTCNRSPGYTQSIQCSLGYICTCSGRRKLSLHYASGSEIDVDGTVMMEWLEPYERHWMLYEEPRIVIHSVRRLKRKEELLVREAITMIRVHGAQNANHASVTKGQTTQRFIWSLIKDNLYSL